MSPAMFPLYLAVSLPLSLLLPSLGVLVGGGGCRWLLQVVAARGSAHTESTTKMSACPPRAVHDERCSHSTCPRDMGAVRWLLVAVTTSAGRHRVSAGPPAEAFVNNRLQSSTSLRVQPRLGRRLLCSSTTPAASIRRSRTAVMATAGAGESWCGHELLNTVTTAWVEDHLGDPELSFLL